MHFLHQDGGFGNTDLHKALRLAATGEDRLLAICLGED